MEQPSKLIVTGEYAHQGFGELALTYGPGAVGSLTWRYRLSANRSVVDEVTIPPRG